jgi:hypothetical protein
MAYRLARLQIETPKIIFGTRNGGMQQGQSYQNAGLKEEISYCRGEKKDSTHITTP